MSTSLAHVTGPALLDEGSANSPSSKMNRSAAVASTAKAAVSILIDQDPRFVAPTRALRRALLVGFARTGRVLYGAAYDLIWCERPIDLADPDAIERDIDAIRIYEIKSTSQPKIGADLKGYFFNITSAELLVAQGLRQQFRFAFVNTFTGTWREMPMNEVFARAKVIYPAFHIKF